MFLGSGTQPTALVSTGASGSCGQVRGTPRSRRSQEQRNNQCSGQRGRPGLRMSCNKAGREFQKWPRLGLLLIRTRYKMFIFIFHPSQREVARHTHRADTHVHPRAHTHTHISLASLPPGLILGSAQRPHTYKTMTYPLCSPQGVTNRVCPSDARGAMCWP